MNYKWGKTRKLLEAYQEGIVVLSLPRIELQTIKIYHLLWSKKIEMAWFEVVSHSFHHFTDEILDAKCYLQEEVPKNIENDPKHFLNLIEKSNKTDLKRFQVFSKLRVWRKLGVKYHQRIHKSWLLIQQTD